MGGGEWPSSSRSLLGNLSATRGNVLSCLQSASAYSQRRGQFANKQRRSQRQEMIFCFELCCFDSEDCRVRRGGKVCKQHLRGTQSSNACISCTVKGVAINSAGGFHTSLKSRVPFLVNSLSAAVPALMLTTSGVVRCQCFLSANTI